MGLTAQGVLRINVKRINLSVVKVTQPHRRLRELQGPGFCCGLWELGARGWELQGRAGAVLSGCRFFSPFSRMKPTP